MERGKNSLQNLIKTKRSCKLGTGTVAVLGILPERIENSQRMTLCWDSAQRDPKVQLQDLDSGRCWGMCVTWARRCFAKQGKRESIIQPET